MGTTAARLEAAGAKKPKGLFSEAVRSRMEKLADSVSYVRRPHQGIDPPPAHRLVVVLQAFEVKTPLALEGVVKRALANAHGLEQVAQ